MTLKTNKSKSKNKQLGFTIVELLIVIVIIGILAAITLVSYVGISKRATETGLQSDLKGAKTQLELYKVEHGTYPTAMDANNCPVTPAIDNNYCINKSIAYTPVGGDGASYSLVVTKNNVSYQTTESAPPFIVMPIIGIGAITGIAQVAQILTAGAVSPVGATVTYQWQSSSTEGGAYTDIPGAVSSEYTLTSNEDSKYVKVIVTGVGAYDGVLSSEISPQIAADPNWIKIGNQTWAKASLNVGVMVNGAVLQTNNSVIEKYCYGNLEANCMAYGALYQWDEAMQYSILNGAQGICPEGSHIPSDNDWKILEVSLGMTQAQADIAAEWRGTNQGTKLKSGGSSGLNLLLAGYRLSDGSIINQGTDAYLWTSTNGGASAWYRYVFPTKTTVYRSAYPKSAGFSVRCLKN